MVIKTAMAKQLKKRVSKKNKSAWRKYADVQDIDNFLDEQRSLERIGNYSDKKDEELFTIDVKENTKLLSLKEKRKRKALKNPNNLYALENRSAIKDPISKRNKVKLKKNGRNILEETIKPTSQKHFQANKDRQTYHAKLEKKLNKKRTLDFKNDIWEQDDNNYLKEFTNQEWVSKNLALHHLKDTGRILAKTPNTLHLKTSLIKSVEAPDAGTSYNPSFEDHQKLIEKVILKEETIVKNELHLKRVTTDMFCKITEQQRDIENLKELTVEIENEVECNQENQNRNANDSVYKSINPPVVVKKKKKNLRQKKEQKEIIREQQERKIKKKIVGDINDLRKIESEILAEEEKKVNMKKKKKKDFIKKRLETKRLGKLKFEEQDIDCNEANKISGNLRNIESESSLLVDRFKVFQKRNILPTSVDVGLRKRKKIKRFTRSSHKEIQQALTKKK